MHQRIGRFGSTRLLASARAGNFELLPTLDITSDNLLHLDNHLLLGKDQLLGYGRVWVTGNCFDRGV